MQAQEMLSDVVTPKGKPWRLSTLVVFDEVSGFYYTRHHMEKTNGQPASLADGIRRNVITFVTPERMVRFDPSTPDIIIRVRTQKAKSLKEAVAAALEEGRSFPGIIEAGNYNVPVTAMITLHGMLGEDFLMPKYSNNFGPIKSLEVVRHDDKWELTVEAYKRGRVVLDDNFKVISAQVIP
jgi:hypothetical protein